MLTTNFVGNIVASLINTMPACLDKSLDFSAGTSSWRYCTQENICNEETIPMTTEAGKPGRIY